MMMSRQPASQIEELIARLAAPTAQERLAALRQLADAHRQGRIAAPQQARDVNNHIHSCFSFSPYTPARAVWQAWQSGLVTAGIMDHDTIAGAREFIEAGDIMGLPTTIGAECRASFAGTWLENRYINNPDQQGIAYVSLHGVPHSQIDTLTTYFRPVRQARFQRSRAMTEQLNRILAETGVRLDFQRDVIASSCWQEGGEITERHLLFAVSRQLLEQHRDPKMLLGVLEEKLRLVVPAKPRQLLTDPKNPYLAYDLLGILKSGLVDQFYIKAEAECPPISELAEFTRAHGIILAYAYLGDVSNSVTGDKKDQAFEDGYLDELFLLLQDLGFQAVTYMPSRNSRRQLLRLRRLCDEHQLFQISGEDINQPRQAFICEAMRDPLFANLYDAAWALIGHERFSSTDLQAGLFSDPTAKAYPQLQQRIAVFSQKARQQFADRKSEKP